MAGSSRLNTDAAVITPAANPRKIRCILPLTLLRNKNTREAPKAVIKKVNPVAAAAQSRDVIILSFLSRKFYVL